MVCWRRPIAQSRADAIRSLLAGGERADVEFKSSLADSRRIIETVAAMADLARLESLGLVTRIGRGKATRWVRW